MEEATPEPTLRVESGTQRLHSALASSTVLAECHSGQGAGGHRGESDASRSQAQSCPCTVGHGGHCPRARKHKSEHLGVVWRRSGGLGRNSATGRLGCGGEGMRLAWRWLIGLDHWLEVLGRRRKIWTPQQECSRGEGRHLGSGLPGGVHWSTF